MGNTLSSKDPGGNTTLRTYLNVQNTTQFISLLASTTTPRGFTTHYGYDGKRNLYSTTRPDANVSYRFYDTAGSLTRLQDFRGNSITYGYDSHEFRVNFTDVGGNRTTYQNDGIGRTWNVTSPGGNVTRKTFDLDSRVTSTTDPMGNTTTYAFDKDGRPTKVTDPNNLIATTSYNLTFGGVQTTVSRGGNTTQHVYDSLGNRIQLIDANNHATRYAYDAFFRLTNSTTPLGHVTKYVYDAAANLISKTEANGTVLRYTYDKSNRILRLTYPGGSFETTAFDADGNVAEKKAFELDDLFAYDALDRVTQTRQVFLDAGLTVWHNYTYDANGNRKSMDGPGGGAYTWNKNNRIASETDAVGDRWTYAYGKEGQLLRETYPDGEYVTYAYDRDGRLALETSYRADATVFEKVAYVYDKVGDVVTKQTPEVTQATSSWQYVSCCSAATTGPTVSGLAPSPQTVTVSVLAHGLAADNVDMPPNCPNTTVTWYYILNGNVVQIGSRTLNLNKVQACYASFATQFSASISLHNGDVLQGEVVYQNDSVITTTVSALSVSFQSATNPTTYAYDKEYRVYKVTSPDGSSVQYTYDAVGNRRTVTSGGSTITYSYDADNELSSSTDGTSYTFDANGDRVSRSVGGVTTNYKYDYATHLAPLSTTQNIASSCTGCTVRPTVQLFTLLPSPQSKTITVTASGLVADDVDYPNCPTVTLSWQYVLNGVGHTVGSQTITLVPDSRLGICKAPFSGTYSSPSPVALASGGRLAGQLVLDAGGSSAYLGGNLAASVSAGTVNVALLIVQAP